MRDLSEDPRPRLGAVREVYDVGRAGAIEYSPDLDGMADPGEIVWTWVPYEEDPSRGKDRPLLIVGRAGRRLLGLMVSTKGESDDPDESLPLGPWGADGRDSFVRLDRVFALDENDIRREGAVLDGERFVDVAVAVKRVHGWTARRG